MATSCMTAQPPGRLLYMDPVNRNTRTRAAQSSVSPDIGHVCLKTSFFFFCHEVPFSRILLLSPWCADHKITVKDFIVNEVTSVNICF